ncbi:Transcriptional regulator, TetR family [[Actinomadura] parvosata subsp. kistnae]|uniref:TetR family transcriptional regulator n=2 Tax=Nonomuraea TaxID=83681 RepID=A0A1V0A9F6_9ACTN|nr:TetR/AcrR family transcriptional regulator [Nonomuraea sp. ATCC 55076]AQZ66847.1 TetR family transcriptional regulator [Nonomuraea sp. ATCC 55076]NJP96452.1 TetR/AcrR family transcriptional regulator [Nonomuraea sp. FMUSA5-5]SPL95014.1 Transcriptional regulator, TetR family [Actinomadura parvosata subsp. kistnae]
MNDQGTAGRIVDVARRILVEEGAEAVSMRRVGDAVGVTAMAIYRHYPSRDALLRAVADVSARELAAAWTGRVSSGGLEERMAAALDDFLDFALGSRHLYRFLVSDAWAGARRFPEDFRDGQGPPFSVVAGLVEEGMRAGFLREDDPLEVAMAVTSGAQGLVQQYLSGRIGMAEDDFRALCHRTTWRIIEGLRAR